jgi:hypothetical protein
LRRLGPEQAIDLVPPSGQLGLRRLSIRSFIHRVVHGAAEVPHHADGAALIVGQD